MSGIRITKVTPIHGAGPKLTLSLIGAPDDGDDHNEAYQHELRRIEQGLRDTGAQIVPQAIIRKNAGASAILTGDFLIVVQTLGPAAFTYLGVWIQSRLGRKVRIKIGDIEVEAATAQEAERLLEKARAIRIADAAKP